VLTSKKWIEQFVDIGDISLNLLVDKLTMSGFEVESTKELLDCKDVVVAFVKEVFPHPHSSNLKLCKLFDGNKTYNVVCGASNISEGLYVPFARPGARLPNKVEIREVEIKGIKSEGMVCSAEELSLEDKSLGIMILANDIKVGENINDIFEFPDFLLDINITPNRGDCLSIRGIAREIAAIFNRPFKDISFQIIGSEEYLEKENPFVVDVVDQEGCPLYVGKIIKNIKIESSPTFMATRLKKVGLNCINNVVDISNYILIECGQPLHTFDLKKIKSGIVVRRASNKESITLLDGKLIKLDENILVISDFEKPIAIAGIMGGEYSGIDNTTENVFLESAFFSPSIIRKTSKKLNISTDASYRFERGVNIGDTERMAEYAGYLLSKYANGKIIKQTFKKSSVDPNSKKSVTFSPKRINELLGCAIGINDQKNIFKRLNIEVSEEGSNLIATIPTYRRDLELEADLAEELARIYGYEHVPEVCMKITADSQIPPYEFSQLRMIKIMLKSLGFCEVINYSFTDENFLQQFFSNTSFIKIKNPISEELKVLRPSIFPSLIKNIVYNLRQGQVDLRLYEIAKVFESLKAGDELPVEKTNLSLAITENFWPLNWIQKVKEDSFYIVKGVIHNLLASLKLDYALKTSVYTFLHPGKSADIFINNCFVGFFGELHPLLYETLDISSRVYVAEVFMTEILDFAKKKINKYEKYSIFPYVNKDLSLIFDESISASDIINIIYSVSPLIESVRLYDIYKDEKIGAGKRSLTFRIVLSVIDRTLTDREANEVLNSIIDICKERFNAILR
jgi:phenylalanyl-tRNA synthetase beta chain